MAKTGKSLLRHANTPQRFERYLDILPKYRDFISNNPRFQHYSLKHLNIVKGKKSVTNFQFLTNQLPTGGLNGLKNDCPFLTWKTW